ncbi:hypothetical protein ACIRD9_24620 [Streptomyces violaceus]|uniref:beta-xylosidase family glycoside hydrolase n=1 Tax=Streptomyces violaceus TaxID=1936 RepID=UPI003804C4CC
MITRRTPERASRRDLIRETGRQASSGIRYCQAAEIPDLVEDGQIRALGFTGAFAGLWAWDLTGGGHHADFDEVRYRAGLDPARSAAYL